MTEQIYRTSTSKRRTKSEMQSLKQSIYKALEGLHPQTLRGLFYVLESQGIVPKTENGYRRIAETTGSMRLSGELPFQWLVDNTRWTLKPDAFNGMGDFLDHAQKLYRRDLLASSNVHIEVWTEKDAVAGLLSDAAGMFDVPVYINRGYPSLTYLYNAAKNIEAIGKPTYIYYFGDSDASGKDIQRVTEQRLREFAPNSEIHFERAAVTEEQIKSMGLPTRPPKKSDPRNKKYSGNVVEVDAIRSDILTQICMYSITDHIPISQLKQLRKIEGMESDTLRGYFNQIKKLERLESD